MSLVLITWQQVWLGKVCVVAGVSSGRCEFAEVFDGMVAQFNEFDQSLQQVNSSLVPFVQPGRQPRIACVPQGVLKPSSGSPACTPRDVRRGIHELAAGRGPGSGTVGLWGWAAHLT